MKDIAKIIIVTIILIAVISLIYSYSKKDTVETNGNEIKNEEVNNKEESNTETKKEQADVKETEKSNNENTEKKETEKSTKEDTSKKEETAKQETKELTDEEKAIKYAKEKWESFRPKPVKSMKMFCVFSENMKRRTFPMFKMPMRNRSGT